MCAGLMNNGSAPVNQGLPDPQEQEQEDCGLALMQEDNKPHVSLAAASLQLLILAAQNAADPFNDVNTCPPCRAGGQTPTGSHPSPAFRKILSSPNISEMTTFTECKTPCVIPTDTETIPGLQFCFNKMSSPLSLCVLSHPAG